MNTIEKTLNMYDEELYKELEGEFEATPDRPKRFGITAVEYAAKEGICKDTALSRLRKMVKNKGWKVQQMRNYNGRPVSVFFKPKKSQ